MSLERKIKYKCKNCGEEFDVTIFDSINASLNPEMREKVIDGSLYTFECPHCKENNYIQYPTLYNDMEHKFMVHANDWGTLLLEHEKLQDDNSMKDFSNLIGQIKQCGACDYHDFITKVVSMENGYDYRLIEISKIIVGYQFSSAMEEKKKNVNLNEVFLTYGNDNQLIYVLSITDENKKNRFVTLPFDKNMYDKIENDFSSDVDRTYDFLFDEEQASKIISYKSHEDKEEALHDILHLAIVELFNGTISLALIPAFNINKFQIDDIVIIGSKKRNITKGKILRLLQMSEFASPIKKDDLIYIMWKVQNIELITTGDSNDELENDELKTSFEEYKNNEYKNKFRPDELMIESDILVGAKTELDLSNVSGNMDDFLESLKIGNDLKIPEGGKLISKFITYDVPEKDVHLLCVYLEQSDLKEDHVSRMIYNFNDIISFVLNNPEKYDGIVINPQNQKIYLTNATLIQYKNERYMCNAKRMTRILEKLTPEEIEYMDRDCYKIICKVYYENKNPKDIAAELGWDEDKVGTYLDYGYEHLIHIVRDNY